MPTTEVILLMPMARHEKLCWREDRTSRIVSNKLKRAGLVVLLLSMTPQCSGMARSGGSAPGGACTWVLSLWASTPASNKATCKNYPAEISFRGRRGLGMVHECRLSGFCKQAPLPLNQGHSVEMAMAVCYLTVAWEGFWFLPWPSLR